MPGWFVMWAMAFAAIGLGKLAMLRLHEGTSWAWLLGWPGMDPVRFHRAPALRPDIHEANGAWMRVAAGALLIWGVGGPWAGLLGLGLLLHFGIVHLLSIHWRLRGYDARPLFEGVLSARSLGEFWGRRWNRAFADFTGRWIYRPLAPRIGARAAVVTVFLASGVGHDLLLSVPARGGYGLCTLYFLIQAAGVLIERRRRSRLRTACVVIAPLPLLFHTPFIENVLVPFLEVIS
ncbi:MAG: MBOAT family protein [Planctomycetota bacterium]